MEALLCTLPVAWFQIAPDTWRCSELTSIKLLVKISQVKVAGGIFVHIFMSNHDRGAHSAMSAVSGLEIKM